MKQHILLLFIIFISSCTSTKTKIEVGTLDGIWKQVDIACQSGQLSEDGAKDREVLQNGKNVIVYIFMGSKNSIYAKLKSENNMTCFHKFESDISYPSVDSISMANTHTAYGCNPTSIPHKRIHSFKLEGNKLKLILSEENQTNPKMNFSSCKSGLSNIILERIL